MRLTTLLCFLGIAYSTSAQKNPSQAVDWLIRPVPEKAEMTYNDAKKEITLNNGLVKRVFRISPNVTCVDYTNLITGQQLLRAVSPEAVITINGQPYHVGGLYGQKEKAYLLPEWVDGFTKNDTDFVFDKYELTDTKPFINWAPGNWWAMNKKQASGKRISFDYIAQIPALKGIRVKIMYEIYDGLPLISKWLTIENNTGAAVQVGRVINEVLAMVEEESAVVGKPEQMKTPQGIYVETNYAFNNAMRYTISDQTTHWSIDSTYTSQVNYNFETPCLLEVYPAKANNLLLQPGEHFTSVRTNELLMDSYDRERRGLAIRTMYNTIAPWTTMNPIFMHLVSKNDDEVIHAIDQCAATGYEALILSFGSHLEMEDSSAHNIQRWKKLSDYAHTKGVRIGGYSLFSSRKISEADDVIDPVTGKTGHAFFGNAPCFGSKWGLTYRDKIKYFFTQTGFDIWENDGPYPGDLCASVTHPGHTGLDDSQWKQMEIQKELYRWLNERGVYINAPDWYFLDGTHKIGIGYREVNFSLSREQQKILNRQNIFDGTWDKTASMSWGFVPLTRYQGGGEEAVLEPLSEHLADYKQLMMQYYGAGVQACYRGPRLYDTDTTKKMVTSVIAWYKKYRDILNAPLIHLRRADGRDWDGWLHANPALQQKGLVMLFNPLKTTIRKTIRLPLYYTGLNQTATIRIEGGKPIRMPLNRKYEIDLPVIIPAGSYQWITIE